MTIWGKWGLVNGVGGVGLFLLLQSTYPILVDDIYNDHQLTSMGSERDVGNTADLNETFEHLNGHSHKLSDVQNVLAQQWGVEIKI